MRIDPPEGAPKPFMLGLAANIAKLTVEERLMIRAAGIQWLRTNSFSFDQELFLKGEEQPTRFLEFKAHLAELRKEGFRVMGITPGPRNLPANAGVPGSTAYLENYRRMCGYLAAEFRGLIDFWQVANELDIWIFRAGLSLQQSVDFLKAGITGVKEADKRLKVGINITLFPSLPGEVDGNTDQHEGITIAKGVYQDSGLDLDYAGFDSYPGTWRQGGPDSWEDYLDAFYELTGKPVIIQEFGYSSEGGLMNAEEISRGAYPCEVKKWKFSWRGGHTPEIQAQFIDETFRILAGKPFVIGATYYRWNDPETCWQCGQADCPAETAWGLVDKNRNPKPSYHAFKSAVQKYFPDSTGCHVLNSGQSD